jgi:hypothetical protein
MGSDNIKTKLPSVPSKPKQRDRDDSPLREVIIKANINSVFFFFSQKGLSYGSEILHGVLSHKKK